MLPDKGEGVMLDVRGDNRQQRGLEIADHVRSKTDVAMVNEVLCKIICHNICCLIQESHELGIDAEFWKAA